MMVFEGIELVGFFLYAYVIIFISGIIALPFVSVRFKPVINILTVSLLSAVTGFFAVKCFTVGEFEIILNGGLFFGNIPLRFDALSGWFILIINFTSVTGALYGAGYLKATGGESHLVSFHWVLYIIFHTSMILVCVIQHSIAFIVAWELMSLSSFFLILYDYTNQKVLKAGVIYLVQMHLSIVFITVAFIWVFFKTGSFDFKGISDFFGINTNIWLFLLFFAGFGLKAGFFGMHTWLPKAHPAAPSHISGVMSGVIVKMGIYGIFRIISFLKYDFLIIGEIILTLSLLTALFGIMNAAVHRDFKKMLAYCTIENIGIIGVGIGIGLIGIAKGQSLLTFLGFGGALLHVLNHSLFKSLLFFSAGSVYTQTHTRDMDKLGGMIKYMPKTGMLFLTGSVAICGIPPLNGFLSEFLIYCGILNGIGSQGISQITLMIITFAGMSLIGGISILAFTKTFGTIFLGSPRREHKLEPEEVSFLMLIPQYAIVAVMISVSFFPAQFINLAAAILNVRTFPNICIDVYDLQNYTVILKHISIASFVFIAFAAILFLIRKLVIEKSEEKISPTWGCGYIAPNVKMQYTAKSFTKSFGKILNFILIEKKGYQEIERTEIFPVQRKYNSFYLDVFERKILNPIMLLLTKFINLFQFVQNGKIQAYVLYGIIFILAIFLGTVLNFWH